MPTAVTEPQLVDELAVRHEIRALQVLQQTAPPPDHLDQAEPSMVILGVLTEVIGQRVDAGTEQRDLDAGRARVRLVQPVLGGSRRLVVTHAFPWIAWLPSRGSGSDSLIPRSSVV